MSELTGLPLTAPTDTAEQPYSYESGLPDTPDIHWEKFRLANGLTVIVHEKRDTPLVSVNLWYRVGSKDEPAGKTGFAHLFEHLMFGGSKHLPGSYISMMAGIGATNVNGTTNHDRTNYYQTIQTDGLDCVLYAESDRMGHFYETLGSQVLEQQRGVVQNEKRQTEGQPYGKVNECVAHGAYPIGHPYAHTVLGAEEDIKNATLEDARGWFAKYYGPSNAVLVLAGDIDVPTAREKVTRFFGDIPPGPALLRPKKWVARDHGQRRDTLEDQVVESRLLIVWNVPPAGDPDCSRLFLAANMLGAGFTSWLYERIVVQSKLATSISAHVSPMLLSGQFSITAALPPGGDSAALEREILVVLADFQARGPAQEELERVKVTNQSRMVRQLGSAHAIADLLAMNEVFFDDPDYYRKDMARLATMTCEDIRLTACEWLGRDANYVLNVVAHGELRAEPQGFDRNDKPTPELTAGIQLPPLHEARLANGMRIVVAERHDMPLVQCRMLIPGGAVLEPTSKMGAAHLTTALMTRGAGRYDADTLSRLCQQHAIGLGAGCDLEYASASVSMFRSRMDLALDLFADVVLRPRFEETELARRKKDLLTSIAQQAGNANGAVGMVMPTLMYGVGHPYARQFSGTASTVPGIERADLLAQYDNLFNPHGATLLVVGDTTLAEILPKLEARFGSWNPGMPGPTPHIGKAQSVAPGIYFIDRPGSAQSTITASLMVPAFEDIDPVLMDAIDGQLAGSFSSRLNMNLREDKNWTYGTKSELGRVKHQRIYSTIVSVQSDKTAESMREIVSEMRGFLGTRPVQAHDLQSQGASTVLTHPAMIETQGGLANVLEMLLQQNLPHDYWKSYAQRTLELTPERFTQTYESLVDADKLVWIVVGDRQRLEQDIKALDLGPFTVIKADSDLLIEPTRPQA